MPNGSSFDFDVVAELNYDGDDESDVSLGSLLEDNDLSFLEYGVVDDDDNDDDADVDPVGGGMVLFDGTCDDCDEDDDDEDGVVPWTDARDEVPVAVSGEPDDQHCSVRGHVLLNEYGNCLVRKDAKLVGSNGQRGIFERIVATAKGKSIPLMYPEGMMFPSIFWWMNHFDGSVLGSLPLSLWASQSETKKFGFAGVLEHIRCRVTNPRLLCGMDPRYIFLSHDILSNLRLRGCDSRFMHLTRGYESLVDQGVVLDKGIGVDEGAMPGEGIDDHRAVKMLSSFTRETKFNYFVTLTCNQKQHPGVAPIYNWVEGRCDEATSDPNLSRVESDEYCNGYRHAAQVLLLREWMDVGEDIMKWIINSSEVPLGVIIDDWWRWEFQDDEGNLPHIHGLLALVKAAGMSDEEFEKSLFDRIVCSSRTIASHEVTLNLVNLNLLDKSEVDGLVEDFCSKQTHSCAASRGRCMMKTGPKPEDKKCRNPHYGFENPHRTRHGFKEIPANHSDEAVELFKRLGFAEETESGRITFIPEFQSGRYVYAADVDEQAVPCNPELFAATRSTQNVQVCTSYTTSRYLAKYVMKKDERRNVEITGTSGGDFVVKKKEIVNTKISRSKRAKDEADRREKGKDKTVGYFIGTMECIAEMLGYPMVHTNGRFVFLDECPLEERPGYPNSRSFSAPLPKMSRHVPVIDQLLDAAGGGIVPGIKVRADLELPSWRRFTEAQCVMIADLLYSPMSVDKVSAFSVRPPELFFCKSPQEYARWFNRLPREIKVEEDNEDGELKCTSAFFVKRDVQWSGWVDGVECRVVVRPAAVEEILISYEDSNEFKNGSQIVFELLNYFLNTEENREFQERLAAMDEYHPGDEDGVGMSDEEDRDGFEDEIRWDKGHMIETLVDSSYTGDHLPVVVHQGIRPSLGGRFLVSVLLSLGCFDTELELWDGTCWLDFFVNAHLLSPRCRGFNRVGRSRATSDEIDDILKRYILEQLMYLPGGTKSFDYYCLTAASVLEEALLRNQLPCDDLSPCLYTQLRRDCTDKLLSARDDLRHSVIETAYHGTPEQSVEGGVDAIVGATRAHPLERSFDVQRGLFQSEESFKEQRAAMRECEDIICQYADPSNRFATKCFLFAGFAGTGKSYMLRHALCCAASLGLMVLASSFCAERAQEFGSGHLNSLLGLDVKGTAKQLAAKAVRKLNRKPLQLFLLQTCDILFIDEFGNVSARFLSAMDMILRRVRDRNEYMGGVLIIASIDVNQMPSVEEIPGLVSSLILTNYRSFLLTKSVRHTTE